MAGTCGYGEELSGSINAGNFLTSGKRSIGNEQVLFLRVVMNVLFLK